MSSPAPPAGFEPYAGGGRFAADNGPFFLYRGDDRVTLGFRVDARHANPVGLCHGGMLATFCDVLMPTVAHRTTSGIEGRFLPTISLQVDFLAPAPLGAWVEGHVDVLRTTRTLVFAQALVTADGVPVARASAIYKIGAAMPS